MVGGVGGEEELGKICWARGIEALEEALEVKLLVCCRVHYRLFLYLCRVQLIHLFQLISFLCGGHPICSGWGSAPPAI